MFSRKTKIVCTIGPSSWDYETLKKLASAGMDVVRMNFSHGTHEEKKQQIENVRKISKDLGKPVAIMADLQGPKLRLGQFEGVRTIEKDEKVQLSISPLSTELPMQFDLSPYVKKGHRIYLNDGLVELKVLEVAGKTIKAQAQNKGTVSSNKGVNVPDTLLKEAAFTQKDYEDAVFALKENVDYLALSFVQRVEDLKIPQQLIIKHNPKVQTILKVEKNEAILHLDEIVPKVNAVMVARGDLAIETSNTLVPIMQQRIIKLCRQLQKPVIVATQMLESMIENPRPTRAEVSDVANAVMDQVDCVMLSAESASGKYPVEAVETMRSVIESVEKNPESKHYIRINWEQIVNGDVSALAITSSAASLSYRIGAKALVVGTATGGTVKKMSAFRPESPIIAVTHDEQTKNQLALIWGVHPIVVKPTANFNTFLGHIYDDLKAKKIFQKGDKIVIVTGITAGVSGTTNTIKVTTF